MASLKYIPNFLQSILISGFNFIAYRQRYGGRYKSYLAHFRKNRALTSQELLEIQKKRYHSFLNYAVARSPFYRERLTALPDYDQIESINALPIINKEMLRKELNGVYTISKSEGIISKTGGTTGKSLEVLFTKDNMQERFAMLDEFRSRYGYRLGKRTAWFSGKSLLTESDVKKSTFWKTDWLYKVRYYSTFHIKDEYLMSYIDDLIRFKPEYLIGFPSTISAIAKFGKKNNIDFPSGLIVAVFPTAETVTDELRNTIESFFKTNVYDQYGSSEGAPLIFECQNHKLHLELQSGVFEVLDESNKPANSGRLVVTSFTTEGTPLIRYDIGDMVTKTDERCTCGNNNPVIREILGRIDDYIYSPKNGKINLGNVSNTLKDTSGIVRFQVVQNKIDEIDIKVQIDENVYSSKTERRFLANWRDRVGADMKISLEYVPDIPNEKSGKYRIVKNNIKSLIDNA